MKVEIEMYTDDDETIVMQKVSLIKQAKEVGFRIGEIELKGPKYKENEDKPYNKGDNR